MATLKSIKNKYLSTSDGTALGVTTNTENVSALSFKLATADNLSKFNLVDGFADDYNDATGVDASSSTNDTRNAAGNYYTGTTATWETGDRSSTITVTSTANTFRDPTSAQAGTAGTNQQFVNGSTTGNNTTDSMRQGINLTVAGRYIAFDLGSAKIVVDAKWYQSTGNGNGTWKWQADSQSNFASAVDVGGSFNLQATDGSNPYTQSWTSDLGSNVTAYRYWRLLGVSGNLTAATDQWIHELEFKVNVAGADMTLQSNAFTAQADPTTARIILDEETAAGTTTLNTDLKAYASRDGTNFTQVTLASQGDLVTQNQGGIDSNTKLMLHCDGANDGTTFTDSSDSPHTVTVVGSTHTDTAVKKFGTASAQFDGAGDQLTVPSSSDWNPYNTSFTADFWVYINSFNDDYDWLLGNTGANYYGWNIQLEKSSTTLNFLVGGGSSWAINTAGGSGYAISTGTWYHIALVKNGTAWTVYVDGASRLTGTSAATDYNNTLQVGRSSLWHDAGNSGPRDFDGYMDEIRISNNARWTADFTPPTAPYTTGTAVAFTRRLLSGSVDVSGQPSGTNMKYKITTHNQAATKETRIYGTSMAWA